MVVACVFAHSDTCLFSPVSGLVVFHFRGCETVLNDPVSGRPGGVHCPIHIGAGFLLGSVSVHCGPGG